MWGARQHFLTWPWPVFLKKLGAAPNGLILTTDADSRARQRLDSPDRAEIAKGVVGRWGGRITLHREKQPNCKQGVRKFLFLDYCYDGQ